MSTFAAESHIEYRQEIGPGQSFTVTTQILAFDHKSIHQYLRMYESESGYLAATSEWVNLHVDLVDRKVAPWPDEVRVALAGLANAQDDRLWPERAGRKIAIRRPMFSLDRRDVGEQ